MDKLLSLIFIGIIVFGFIVNVKIIIEQIIKSLKEMILHFFYFTNCLYIVRFPTLFRYLCSLCYRNNQL